jgi:hypothetical protein
MGVKSSMKTASSNPLETVTDMATGQVCRVFSEEQLNAERGDLPWLCLAEKSFDFWDNEEDAYYDNL